MCLKVATRLLVAIGILGPDKVVTAQAWSRAWRQPAPDALIPFEKEDLLGFYRANQRGSDIRLVYTTNGYVVIDLRDESVSEPLLSEVLQTMRLLGKGVQ